MTATVITSPNFGEPSISATAPRTARAGSSTTAIPMAIHLPPRPVTLARQPRSMTDAVAAGRNALSLAASVLSATPSSRVAPIVRRGNSVSSSFRS